MRAPQTPRYLEPALDAALLLLVIGRIGLLPFSPPGFYVDEAAGGAHIKAILISGTNAHGRHWPLFFESLAGGYTTPVYLYPATGWGRVLGTGELSLRYFSQVCTLGAIACLALGARYWLGRAFGLGVAVVALAMPWHWLQGSLAWDPALVPLFVGAAFLALSVLLFSSCRPHLRLAAAGLPAFLVCLAYVYPPCRMTAPLLFAVGYGVLVRRGRLTRAGLAGGVGFATVLALPLAHFMLQSAARARSAALSAFHDASVWDGFVQTAANVWTLLSPVFLFLHGDGNLRHATGRQGMLGVGSVAPAVVVALYARYVAVQRHQGSSPHGDNRSLLLGIAATGAVAGILGPALTHENGSHPHSLRATAASISLETTETDPPRGSICRR